MSDGDERAMTGAGRWAGVVSIPISSVKSGELYRSSYRPRHRPFPQPTPRRGTPHDARRSPRRRRLIPMEDTSTHAGAARGGRVANGEPARLRALNRRGESERPTAAAPTRSTPTRWAGTSGSRFPSAPTRQPPQHDRLAHAGDVRCAVVPRAERLAWRCEVSYRSTSSGRTVGGAEPTLAVSLRGRFRDRQPARGLRLRGCAQHHRPLMRPHCDDGSSWRGWVTGSCD